MKTITTSFFSTLSIKQTKLACSFFWPWNWFKIKKGKSVLNLEKKFSSLIGTKFSKSFYNARSAIYHGLKALGIGEGDEVIIQAYTCVSVPNSIIALKAKPVYVDIDENNLNIDLNKIEQGITAKTKAIMIQHTFGTPVDIEKVQSICDKHDIALIEDCAHSLGAKYKNDYVGSFGLFSVFSFGRDKVISGVNGGMLCTNNQSIIDKIPVDLPLPSLTRILQNLSYPFIANLSKSLYSFIGLGKVIISLSKKFRFIPQIVSVKEKCCQDVIILNYALPNCLAELILSQLDDLDKINQHRQEIAEYYFKSITNNSVSLIKNNESIYLRVVILLNQRQKFYDHMKQHKVILGNWYDKVISPRQIDLQKAQYELGSCLIAEKVARQTLNLPNHFGVSLKQAEYVVGLINKFK